MYFFVTKEKQFYLVKINYYEFNKAMNHFQIEKINEDFIEKCLQYFVRSIRTVVFVATESCTEQLRC